MFTHRVNSKTGPTYSFGIVLDGCSDRASPPLDDPCWKLSKKGDFTFECEQDNGSVLCFPAKNTDDKIPEEWGHNGEHAEFGKTKVIHFSGTSKSHKSAGKYTSIRVVDSKGNVLFTHNITDAPIKVSAGGRLTVVLGIEIIVPKTNKPLVLVAKSLPKKPVEVE